MWRKQFREVQGSQIFISQHLGIGIGTTRKTLRQNLDNIISLNKKHVKYKTVGPFRNTLHNVMYTHPKE
jgi:hypothetical protein